MWGAGRKRSKGAAAPGGRCCTLYLALLLLSPLQVTGKKINHSNLKPAAYVTEESGRVCLKMREKDVEVVMELVVESTYSRLTYTAGNTTVPTALLVPRTTHALTFAYIATPKRRHALEVAVDGASLPFNPNPDGRPVFVTNYAFKEIILYIKGRTSLKNCPSTTSSTTTTTTTTTTTSSTTSSTTTTSTTSTTAPPTTTTIMPLPPFTQPPTPPLIRDTVQQPKSVPAQTFTTISAPPALASPTIEQASTLEDKLATQTVATSTIQQSSSTTEDTQSWLWSLGKAGTLPLLPIILVVILLALIIMAVVIGCYLHRKKKNSYAKDQKAERKKNDYQDHTASFETQKPLVTHGIYSPNPYQMNTSQSTFSSDNSNVTRNTNPLYRPSIKAPVSPVRSIPLPEHQTLGQN